MKYLILILVILVATFLMNGNYSLVLKEGATFAEETETMKNNIGKARQNSNSINGGAREARNNVHGLSTERFTFSMKEGFDCSKPCHNNYSSLATKGSTATLDVCETKRKLECQNP